MQSYIRFRKPTFFTFREKIVLGPVLVAKSVILALLGVLLVSPLLAFVVKHRMPHLFLPFWLAGVGVFVILSVWFSPWLQGNRRIRKRFKLNEGEFVLQMRFLPRRYTGFEGWLEDADDVGVLRVESDCLLFRGDASDICVYKDDIRSVSTRNVGHRAFWAWGHETVLTLHVGIQGVLEVAFSSREALTVPATRRLNAAIAGSVQALVS